MACMQSLKGNCLLACLWMRLVTLPRRREKRSGEQERTENKRAHSISARTFPAVISLSLSLPQTVATAAPLAIGLATLAARLPTVCAFVPLGQESVRKTWQTAFGNQSGRVASVGGCCCF